MTGTAVPDFRHSLLRWLISQMYIILLLYSQFI
jgi:hypothetical protein